jgi:CubicO group peptidase (beta-lactamase class C family)
VDLRQQFRRVQPEPLRDPPPGDLHHVGGVDEGAVHVEEQSACSKFECVRRHSSILHCSPLSPSARRARLVLALLALAAAAGATGCTAESKEAHALDEVISEFPDDAPGCAAAVYDDDELAWTGVRGLADVEGAERITDDTVFGLDTTSQMFTSTALLLLADRGELDVDEPIRKYLPTLPDWADTVTIEHLFTHTTGLPHSSGLLQSVVGEPTTENLLEGLGQVQRLEFEPGTRIAYGDTNYLVQGLLVEAVSGRPFGEFLKEEVFSPAGVDAVFDPNPDIPERAMGYTSAASTAPLVGWASELPGDSGVQSTASDLAKWGAQFWEPTVGSEEIRAARTRKLVVATDGEDPATPLREGVAYFGAGILAWPTADEQLIITRFGIFNGFASDVAILPHERVAAALLCNHEDVDVIKLAQDLANTYVAER